MKVLILEGSTYPTGALKSILSIAKILSINVQFEFAMKGHTDAANLVELEGFPVHDISFAQVGRKLSVLLFPFLLIRDGYRIRKIAKKIKANIIHVNDIHLLAGAVAVGHGKKYSLVQHCRLLRSSYIGPFYSFFTFFARHYSSIIFAVSPAVLNDLGCPVNAIVVHDAIGESSILPEKTYRNHINNCRFLYLGNYVEGKGHDVALSAFLEVLKTYPNSTLTMFGVGLDGSLDGNYVASLKSTIHCSELTNKVFLCDRVNNVEEVMKKFDILINLSFSESFSMVCLEAMTYGIPLISAKSGGPNFLIEDGVTGLLVRPRDIMAAAEAMKQFVSNPINSEKIARRAVKESALKYSIDLSSTIIMNGYKQVIKSQSENVL